MSDTFTADMLPYEVDAADTLYVTDRDLNVVYSNLEWERFANANQGRDLLAAGWSGNVLASFSGRQREHWEHVYRLLLAGRLPHHQEQMNCSSPEERRIYELRITPQKDEGGEVAWLVHHNIRIDNKAEPVDRVERKLDAMDDRTQLKEEFEQRFRERKIRIPGFDVACHFEPLDEIGGDLVWHREYPNGASDLVHADVMGHGIRAGRVAAKLAIVLDEIASPDLTPSGAVGALNRALARIAPGDEVMFASGLYFRFERDLRRVTCCNFGHESPIFARTGAVRIPGGCPVGLLDDDVRWTDVPIALDEHGTEFLVFSDGITEQFDREGVMFGIDRLLEAFRRHLDAPLEERLRRIARDVADFRGSALVKDDQTLIALGSRAP